jgi:hypothetical protein
VSDDKAVRVQNFLHGLLRGSQDDRNRAAADAEYVRQHGPITRIALRVGDTVTVYTTKKRTRNVAHPSAKGGKWITPERRWAIYHRDGYACIYCNDHSIRGAAGRLTLDHRRCIASAGRNNASSNLLTCCLSCNSSKKGLSMRAWLARLEARGIDTTRVRKRLNGQPRKKVDLRAGAEAYELSRLDRAKRKVSE